MESPLSYDDPSHPFKNEGRLFLKKYAEFYSVYQQMMGEHLPASITSVSQNLSLIIVVISIIKISLALLFVGGEKSAAWFLIWVFYPLRTLFYYNPFSEYNQPREDPQFTEGGATRQDRANFDNSSKLRQCYIQIQWTLVVVGGILLAVSSPSYRPSKWLKKFYRFLKRQMRSAKHHVLSYF